MRFTICTEKLVTFSIFEDCVCHGKAFDWGADGIFAVDLDNYTVPIDRISIMKMVASGIGKITVQKCTLEE